MKRPSTVDHFIRARNKRIMQRDVAYLSIVCKVSSEQIRIKSKISWIERNIVPIFLHELNSKIKVDICNVDCTNISKIRLRIVVCYCRVLMQYKFGSKFLTLNCDEANCQNRKYCS